eukprot:gene10009-11733_t
MSGLKPLTDQRHIGAPSVPIRSSDPCHPREEKMSQTNPLIIDVHGHYTTAPKALEDWRNKQIAGIKDPSVSPKVSELKISDDEL